MSKRKLYLHNKQSPGDILMLTATVRDLHLCYPDQFLTNVETSCPALWENNPYITSEVQRGGQDTTFLDIEYGHDPNKNPNDPYHHWGLVHLCNEGAYHFTHGFTDDLNHKLGLSVRPQRLGGDVHISDEEKSWFSQVYEILGEDVPYWIVNAGCKSDFTAKQWEVDRFQQVIDALPETIFVQVGAGSEDNQPDMQHLHPMLHGENLINLVGKTDMRQFVRLMYHAYGVITGVSFAMHLCASIEPKLAFRRKSRACVVIAGGREPTIWEAYTNHAYLHTCGILPCCDNGGCWKSRTVKRDDGQEHDNSLCFFPVKTPNGQVIPKCLDMITAEDVIRKVKDYITMGGVL